MEDEMLYNKRMQSDLKRAVPFFDAWCGALGGGNKCCKGIAESKHRVDWVTEIEATEMKALSDRQD